MAARARDVAVQVHPRIACVVEDALAPQHRGRERLGRHRGHRRDDGGLVGRPVEQGGCIQHGHRPIEEVVHVEAPAVGLEGQAHRRPPHLDAAQQRLLVRVPELDQVGALQRDHERVARGRERHRLRQVAVVEVDAPVRRLGVRGQVDLRDDRPRLGLEVQVLSVPVSSAGDVVLLGWNPRRGAVGRDAHLGQVVRYPAAPELGVRTGAEAELDGPAHREAGRVHLVDLAHRAALGEGGHETGDEDARRVSRHGDSPRPRREFEVAHHGAAGVELQQPARPQGHVGRLAVRGEDDPVGRRAVAEVNPAGDQTEGVQHGDFAAALVRHPDLAVRRLGEGAGVVTDPDLPDLAVVVEEPGHGVVVRVRHVDARHVPEDAGVALDPCACPP